jgi:hypothetical protein
MALLQEVALVPKQWIRAKVLGDNNMYIHTGNNRLPVQRRDGEMRERERERFSVELLENVLRL